MSTRSDLVANDGRCSLREAITSANTDDSSGPRIGECRAGSAFDTVALAAGAPYRLSIHGAGEGANASGDLDVLVSGVTIAGAGARTTTIDGAGVDRVLDIAPSTIVALEGVTITGGRTPAGGAGGPGANGESSEAGGGIRNGGTLTVRASAITSNRTGRGGRGGDATGARGSDATGSSDATAGDPGFAGGGGRGGDGGGIFNSGALTLVSSTVAANGTGAGGAGADGEGGHGGDGKNLGNSNDGAAGGDGYAGGGGRGGDGGGLAQGAGSLIARNSTVAENTTGAGGSGGKGTGGDGGDGRNGGPMAIGGNGGAGGDGFTGGAADGGFGGGIYVDSGTASVTSSTIARNVTGIGGLPGANGIGGAGGARGLGDPGYSDGSPGAQGTGYPASAGGGAGNGGGISPSDDTTIKSTIVALNLPTNCGAPPAAQGVNLSFPDASCPGSNANPRLGSLADNGGQTLTLALGAGSGALDKVPGCSGSDQRGVHRPAGAACDLGAYELTAPVLSALTVKPRKIVSGRSAVIGFTLSEPAQVKLLIQQRVAGLKRKGGACGKASAKHVAAAPRAKRCTRYPQRGVLRRSGKPRINTVHFSGRVGGHTLHAGRYRLVASATGAAGRRAKPHQTDFTITAAQSAR